MANAASQLLTAALFVGLCATSAPIAAPAPPAMVCAPAILHATGTLHIVLPSPHGRYLEVKPPTGENVSIAFAFDNKQRAIIPEKTFLTMKTIDLRVSEAKAFEWKHMQPVKLFDKPGRYKFGVGDDFETDAPQVDGECTVQFSP